MVYLTTINGADPNLSEIRHSPLVGALPFKEDKKTMNSESHDETDEDEEYDNWEREETQNEDHRVLRISTRARLAFNLERYDKNAMLVFNANAAVGAGLDERISERIAAIIETFSSFRFEIETHLDLTEEEIDDKCVEFFQRDFSEYGCVAVIVLTFEGTDSLDSTIVRHWTEDGNPTLRHKPKLYISEASQSIARRELYPKRNRRYRPPPITEDYPNVICLHLPFIFHIDARQPFQVFCDKLTDMADVDDMMTIIKVAIKETKVIFRFKIDVASTLEKMLFLARTEAEVTRL